jgi:hypothetical protein
MPNIFTALVTSMASRCQRSPCQNFASSQNNFICNSCSKGLPPTVDPSRNTIAAAALDPTNTKPNSSTEIDAKLASSLVAARSFADACPIDQRRGDFVPFRFQRKVDGKELAFDMGDGVFLGSEYGAADVGLLRGLGISLVINVTAGSRLVPNFGESVAGYDVTYANFMLDDRIGTDVAAVLAAMRDASARIERCVADGRHVFVHCSAGLCRSTTLVMAWLMAGRRRMSLGDAVASLTSARGRPPVISASYASALVRFEREAAAARGDPVPAVPTADFSDNFVEDVSVEAGLHSLQLAPEADIRRMLKDLNGDADAVFRKLLP